MFFSHWLSISLFMSVNNIFLNARIFKRSPIIGGNQTQPNEFPYVVAIISPRGQAICGGGIIGERHILTAAHCVTDRQNHFLEGNLSIIANTNNVKIITPNPNTRTVAVQKIFIPKTFTYDIRQADIAILKLVENLNVAKYHLQILKLPAKSRRFKVGLRGVVAGFGACNIVTTLNGTEKIVKGITYDGMLRSANVEIIDKAVCKNNVPYANFQIGTYHLLARMIKHSDEIFGMCYGDSGSPLVIKPNIVIGIMIDSFDKGCDERNTPAIYTKLTYYRTFICAAMSDTINNRLRVKIY